MTIQEAQNLIADNGLEWKVTGVKSEKCYHFIKCEWNRKNKSTLIGTVVYNDKLKEIIKITQTGERAH